MAKKQMPKEIIIKEESLPSNANSNRTAPIREQQITTNTIGGGGLVNATTRYKSKKDKKKAKAIIKKKSFTRSIAEALVGDTTENVSGYILHDVLIPAAKNTIQEMVQSGIEMLLFGERRSKSRDRDRGSTKISYGSYYRDREDSRRERPRARSRDKFDLSEIYFRDGRDADDVLRNLCDALEEYEQVTVADYFDFAGIEGASWAHQKYGWDDNNDLRDARCTHTRNGWQILLPDPTPLD